HATAVDYQATDWARILSLYDRLVEFDESPVIALNRAVAVANVHGPHAGLKAVRAIKGLEKLASYYLFYSVIGELEMRLNNRAAAAEQFRRAFELAETKSERAFLLKRLQQCADAVNWLIREILSRIALLVRRSSENDINRKANMSNSDTKQGASMVCVEIPADNPERAKAFYSNLFGWKINPFPGNGDYLHIDTGGADESPDGAPKRRKNAEEPIVNYISVNSVDKFADRV